MHPNVPHRAVDDLEHSAPESFPLSRAWNTRPVISTTRLSLYDDFNRPSSFAKVSDTGISRDFPFFVLSPAKYI
jgi:hypothetical protein